MALALFASFPGASGAQTLARHSKLDAADAALVRLVKRIPLDYRTSEGPAASVTALLKGWRSYTRLECALIGDATGGSPRAKGEYESMCEERRYAARLAMVQAAALCLRHALHQPRRAESALLCLARLTPLKLEGDFDG